MLIETVLSFVIGLVVFVVFYKNLSRIQRIRKNMEPYLGRVLSNAVIGFFAFAITGALASIVWMLVGLEAVDSTGSLVGVIKEVAAAALVSGIAGLLLIAVVAAITKRDF
ncbi:MAG: hypothetical protein H6667_20795 [Ardenticatenaceae bacterium]|nr:hypothetical protein [Ardenticatenaceae bacterium]